MNFFARIFSSNAKKKQLASTALQAGNTAAKDIGLKAIDVNKIVAIDAGKKLVEKAAKKNQPQQNYKWLMLWFNQKKSLKK